MNRRSPLPLKTLLAVAALALSPAAGASAEDRQFKELEDESLWANDELEAYAVEIEEVLEESGTNSNPPAVTLKIVESLRGEAKADELIPAKWLPVPCTFMIKDPPRFEAWRTEKLSSPAKGTRWLVLSYSHHAARPFGVFGWGRFEWTAENRDWCRKFTDGWRERNEKREEAAKAHAAAVAKRKEEDPALQEKVDLAGAIQKSTSIVVGTLDVLVEVGLVTVKVEEALRGGNPGGIGVMMPMSADTALTLEARAGTRVIAFLCGENRATCGAWCLEAVDGVNGLLTATPERLKKVKEALGLGTPEK